MKIIKKVSVFIFVICLMILFYGFQINDIAYAKSDYVYLGGIPIGIIGKSDKLIVSEIVNVTTTDGCFSPALNGGIRKGDIILSVDDKPISDITELNDAIMNSTEAISFNVLRQNDNLNLSVVPVLDLTHNAKKVGLMVKNELSGIGTLTYVTHDNKYGALGHLIMDEYGYGDLYKNGNIFPCKLNGYVAGKEGIAGELLGSIITSKGAIGSINRNTFCGLFGEYYPNENVLLTDKIQIGNIKDITPGKAQIYTSIDDNAPEFYDIEIIKAEKQSSPTEKSMVIRVTDSYLKEKTGGILQGMSGSPIIQKGKIIGAVTHVFISDPTKGYGIYLDWMFEKAS